ncbi:MAG: DUF2169 domain-containing protein [Polyangiaceae bacterium]
MSARGARAAPPRVTLRTDGSVSAESLLWRYRGRLHLTVAATRMFSLASDGAFASARANRPIVSVPYLRRCDVIVEGMPAPLSAPVRTAELQIARDTTSLLHGVFDIVPRGDLSPTLTDASIKEIPDATDWDRLQRAPLDHQVEHLRGGEWVRLTSNRQTTTTRLPLWRPSGVVQIAGRPGAHTMEMLCDTVAIDVDRQTMTAVWRGFADVTDARDLAAIAVIVARDDAPSSSSGSSQARTLALDPARGRTLPLEVSPARTRPPLPPPPSSPRTSPSTAATPWGSEPVPPAPPRASAAALTLDLAPPGDVGERTIAMRADEHARVAARRAAPFPEPEARPTAVAQPIAGAPWAAVAAPAPPAAVPGEQTLSLEDRSRSAPRASAPPAADGARRRPPIPVDPLAARLRAAGADGDDVAAMIAALKRSR